MTDTVNFVCPHCGSAIRRVRETRAYGAFDAVHQDWNFSEQTERELANCERCGDLELKDVKTVPIEIGGHQ